MDGVKYVIRKHRDTGEWYFVVYLDGHMVYGMRGFQTWDQAMNRVWN